MGGGGSREGEGGGGVEKSKTTCIEMSLAKDPETAVETVKESFRGHFEKGAAIEGSV